MNSTAIKSLRRTLMRFVGMSLVMVLLLWLAQSAVLAHPIAQGALRCILFGDHIEIEARIPFEEVVIASTAIQGAAPKSLRDGLRAHGQYLLAHLHLLANGRPLTGSVEGIDELTAPKAAPDEGNRVTFRLLYALPRPAAPAQFKLSEDILNEIAYSPGNRWEATYVVSVVRELGGGEQGMLLTSTQPVTFSGSEFSGKTVSTVSSWSTFKSFCWHGSTHILTGYDHLLFIATLVLAARRFWDLFKVVGTFTVAHGITLTLSVLDIVRLPERIVEPMIAASIVYVAVENVFFPQRSRSWTRLCAAFFFGLFHGLGFAGGLLEAMAGMPGVTVAVALIAFSVGVELGHQAVVVPLYGTISLIRRQKTDEDARARQADLISRYASGAISIAGLFYFITAITAR